MCVLSYSQFKAMAPWLPCLYLVIQALMHFYSTVNLQADHLFSIIKIPELSNHVKWSSIMGKLSILNRALAIGRLVVVDVTLNSQWYIDQILETCVVPFAQPYWTIMGSVKESSVQADWWHINIGWSQTDHCGRMGSDPKLWNCKPHKEHEAKFTIVCIEEIKCPIP